MKIGMYSVLDGVAGEFLEPFFSMNDDTAIRGFRGAVETDGHQFAKYPEDFSLHYVGGFDSQLGEVSDVGCRKIAMATSFSGGFGNQISMEA